MKKYLMFAFAALAFVGCSKSEDVSDSSRTKVQDTYNSKFVQNFGQPAANHTWGFGATATKGMDTRASINVNGNLWEETSLVAKEEVKAIYDYVNKVKSSVEHYSETAPDNIHNYYVTHVWGGNTTNPDGRADNNTLYVDIEKEIAGRTTDGLFLGSKKMNNLHIAQSTEKGAISIEDGDLKGDWEHINNFNAASNTNYGGNTLVTGGGTLDFAYMSSQDSKYHNKWIIVDGQYIGYPGKYYVCFDYMADGKKDYPTYTPVTGAQFWNPYSRNSDKWENVPTTITLPGPYTKATASTCDYPIDIVVTEYVNGVETKHTLHYNVNNSEQIRISSVGNVVNGNYYTTANDIYTDWIIRLVPAQEKKVDADVRIIAEDLSVNTGTDFDFNDVVFDVKWITDNKAKITLRAAGGTLPLYIHSEEHEVHKEFGYTDTNVMINTNATAKGYQTIEGADSKDPVSFEIEGAFNRDAKNIIIWVIKDGKRYNLNAYTGEPAAKIAVRPTFQWVMEKVALKSQYPLFPNYVGDESVAWY